jgi:manganese-dependent inorganic pyrophosphatase
MSSIKVFGHKSPDTDASCSAIVWAWFLKTHRNQDATPYVLGTPNSEASFVLEKWGHETPEILESVSSEDTVAIVDTNSIDELFENINDTHIVSIIDHHKLTGGIKTSSPREIVIQPYASTMTVMYNVMNIEPEDFPKEIAGLMLSGLLSDTLEFRSPTTTEDDKVLAERLAQAAGVDISEYAAAMFEAKSDISTFSDDELIKLDSKITEIKGKKMRISVLETTHPSSVFARRAGIIASSNKSVEAESLDYLLFFVVDILKEESTLISDNVTTKEMVAEAFGVDAATDDIVLPNVVSRKKQIIPTLSE